MADWLERVMTLKARVKARPETTIPEMQWLNEKDWLDAAKDNPLANDDDFRRAGSRLRGTAENKFTQKASPALQRYLKANNGKFPTDTGLLLPYFEPPLDPTILQSWVVKPDKEVPRLQFGGDWVIT